MRDKISRPEFENLEAQVAALTKRVEALEAEEVREQSGLRRKKA